MRKLITSLLAVILAICLTGCLPSGNLVGKATFTTDENFEASGLEKLSPGEPIASIEVNGGAVATPKGTRFRVTKAIFSIGSLTINAAKGSFLDVVDDSNLFRENIKTSILKGKNFCSTIQGRDTSDKLFLIFLGQQGSEQFMMFAYFGVEGSPPKIWGGVAPANSLKIGGRNLCRLD